MPEYEKIELKKTLHPSTKRIFSYCMEDVLKMDHDNNSSIQLDGNVMERYENFKRFDVVNDLSDHLIAKHSMTGLENITKRYIESELKNLEKDLPCTQGIFVRVYNPRVDFLRAVIIGPKGTPYHDGLFFFDMVIPIFYPTKSAPGVRYHSAGLQINPNMYMCGEVFVRPFKVSVTRDGSLQREEMWNETTNLLQFLVSIRDVFLNANPLFLRSGFKYSQQQSVLYNENIIIKSLKIMVYIMNKPPKHFEDFVVGHFRSRVRDILMACKAYIEGGFLEGFNAELCSITFKNEVASCIKPLVDAFIKIGANEAQEFLHLSENKFPLPHEPDLHAWAWWNAPMTRSEKKRRTHKSGETDANSIEDLDASKPAQNPHVIIPKQENEEEQVKTSMNRRTKKTVVTRSNRPKMEPFLYPNVNSGTRVKRENQNA